MENDLKKKQSFIINDAKKGEFGYLKARISNEFNQEVS